MGCDVVFDKDDLSRVSILITEECLIARAMVVIPCKPLQNYREEDGA